MSIWKFSNFEGFKLFFHHEPFAHNNQRANSINGTSIGIGIGKVSILVFSLLSRQYILILFLEHRFHNISMRMDAFILKIESWLCNEYSLLVTRYSFLNLDYIMSTRCTWIFFLIFDHIQRDVCQCVDNHGMVSYIWQLMSTGRP